jgi:hypothetical protein
VQSENGGEAQAKSPFRLEPVVHHFNHGVELLQTVAGFLLCFKYIIRDQLGIKRPAVTVFLMSCILLQQRCLLVDHFTRDAVVFDMGVSVSEASTLLFLFSQTKRAPLRGGQELL